MSIQPRPDGMKTSDNAEFINTELCRDLNHIRIPAKLCAHFYPISSHKMLSDCLGDFFDFGAVLIVLRHELNAASYAVHD